MKKRAIVAFAALWAFGCSQTPTATPERIAPLLEGIGELHHEITTSSAEAQRYFDQGLSLLYGFNHLEAIRSFEQAALLDPDCAMCFWGQALAHGPNINDPAPDAEREQKAYAAIERALALAAGASEPESAAIEALAPRYAAEASDRAALNAAYAEAMTALHESYPDDPDFSTLYVAVLMNTTPWDYSSPECWDLFTEVLAVEYGNVSLFR